jgi:hypothetical protein
MKRNGVVLVGSGGKMGMRLTQRLKDSQYDMKYVEIAPQAVAKLEELGVQVSPAGQVLPHCGIVIMAIPDVAFAKVSSEVIPQLKAGSMVVTLDPAATLAGKMTMRDDLAYFISHPAHPSVFNWEPDQEAQTDFFGGIMAKQCIINSLVQGNDEDYLEGEALARTMYAPVTKSHRVSVEHMGLLEPGLVETLSATCITVIRQGLDEVVKMGVPAEAARDFLLGHINVSLAVLFDELPGVVFSDAANKAVENAMGQIFRDDWKKVLTPENVQEQIQRIT